MKYYLYAFCNGELMEEKEFNYLCDVKDFIVSCYYDDIRVFYGFDITEELQ